MKQSAELRQRLKTIEVDAAPMEVSGRLKTIWVEPRLKINVEHHTITAAGLCAAPYGDGTGT